VVGGLRYNRSSTQATDYRVSSSAGTKSTFSQTTPQLGLGYKVSSGILLYGSYSQSYAVPAQAVLRGIAFDSNGQPQQVLTGQAVPVRGEGYELGVKTELLEGKLTSTLSLYEITQSDVVLTVGQQLSSGSFNVDNQGTGVRGRGAEMDMIFTPSASWQFIAGLSQEDIRNNKMPAGLSYYLGAHPVYTVKTLGNLWARYNVVTGKLKGLWGGAGFNYVGPKALDSKNKNLFAPAYTLWNATLGYDWKWDGNKMKAQLNFQNITDTDYQPSAATVGLPRRVVLTLTAEF
jgi:iron complex outermembrane receptor protein